MARGLGGEEGAEAPRARQRGGAIRFLNDDGRTAAGPLRRDFFVLTTRARACPPSAPSCAPWCALRRCAEQSGKGTDALDSIYDDVAPTTAGGAGADIYGDAAGGGASGGGTGGTGKAEAAGGDAGEEEEEEEEEEDSDDDFEVTMGLESTTTAPPTLQSGKVRSADDPTVPPSWPRTDSPEPLLTMLPLLVLIVFARRAAAPFPRTAVVECAVRGRLWLWAWPCTGRCAWRRPGPVRRRGADARGRVPRPGPGRRAGRHAVHL